MTKYSVIGHRGYAGAAPENTKAAFEKALNSNKVDGVECDIQLTKDGRLVVIHAYDTKIFLQLHHPGNETMGRLLHGKQIVAPSPVMCRIIGEMPRELTTEEVTAMAQKFVKGAVIAKTAGFDGVEVHAAHAAGGGGGRGHRPAGHAGRAGAG